MEKTLSINKERTTVMDCCKTALLAVLIAVSGTFRIPGIVPGTEFQLSAPIAVAICGVFGFKKYIIAGILASLMGLSLGTCTILNVAIQMSFRLGVGAFWLLSGSNRFSIFFRPLRHRPGPGGDVLPSGQGPHLNARSRCPRHGFHRRHGLGLRKDLHPLPESSENPVNLFPSFFSNLQGGVRSDIPLSSCYNDFIH